MERRVEKDGWSLAVPEGWEVHEEPDSTSLVPPSGRGALQLSGHRKSGGAVSDGDLLELASDHIQAGAPRRDVRLGEFMGFEIAYEADGYARREWYLRKKSTLLFASWSCEVRHEGAEDETVELALVTLRQLS
ncbi:MAG: hypothetical protein AAF957_18270 [Planctomycetota bacterium]